MEAMRALRDAREYGGAAAPPGGYGGEAEGGFANAQPRYAGLFRDGYDEDRAAGHSPAPPGANYGAYGGPAPGYEAEAAAAVAAVAGGPGVPRPHRRADSCGHAGCNRC